MATAAPSSVTRIVRVASVEIGGGRPLVLIGGPCVIESEASALRHAMRIKEITESLGVPYIFKASYDKANRSSSRSFRGIGIDQGLDILSKVKSRINVPVLSDVHSVEQVHKAAAVLDVIQIPAFLCRQTDLLEAAARTGKTVNVKKGQFMAPWDMANVIEKLEDAGNKQILLTERGTSFGYNNLVSDFRSIPTMRSLGCPVIFDATHSVQLPGGQGTSSGGQREFIPVLAKCGVVSGADAIFLEIHENPKEAKSDGPNAEPLDDLAALLKQLKSIAAQVREV